MRTIGPGAAPRGSRLCAGGYSEAYMCYPVKNLQLHDLLVLRRSSKKRTKPEQNGPFAGTINI
jgi:hypothetical protein